MAVAQHLCHRTLCSGQRRLCSSFTFHGWADRRVCLRRTRKSDLRLTKPDVGCRRCASLRNVTCGAALSDISTTRGSMPYPSSFASSQLADRSA